MSFRIRRKSRPQADVEIFGGPLKQSSFKGGMNIDAPASEINTNQVAYAENVIFREYGCEARPGTVQFSTESVGNMTPTLVYGWAYSPITYTGTYADYRNIVSYNGKLRMFTSVPGYNGTDYQASGDIDYTTTTGDWAPGTGDCTIIPYRRGFLTFTSSKISYTESLRSFQVNAPNPVHGLKDDYAVASTHVYRYLFTLSRIITYGQDPTSFTISADRLEAGAEVVHESGTNGKRYSTSSTSTARNRDYGEIYSLNPIDLSTGYTVSAESLQSALGSIASITANDAAKHFTHVSVYRTKDLDDLIVDRESGKGNSAELYVWVMDVPRGAGGSIAATPDTVSDAVLDTRISSGNLILRTRGFTPMPAGSCAELASGWMFVSDRTNATPETRMSYCAIGANPQHFGYYFADVQNYRFSDGIRAMKANQDILSIFCNGSSHICNLTAFEDKLSSLQSVPFLTYFQAVDRAIGVRDWGTIDSLDKNTLIAVCSDSTVRMWDTTKWGDDISYGLVNTEIRQIVPASTTTYGRGSVGKYYKGAYYLWYSKDATDTATTKCLRFGFGKQAGYGWSYYTGWKYPMFKTGVQVMMDSNGVQRLVVMSSTDSSLMYWVETFAAFTGATDAIYSTGIGAGTRQLIRYDVDAFSRLSAGTEIACTIKFRELIGAEEADYLVHDETFIKWRPLSVADGYRSAFALSLSAYENGSATATETVATQPKTASIKFTKEIADRRVQLGVTTVTGAWRITGVESHFRSLDRINYATSGDVSSSESTTGYPQYQAALASDMTHWITRRETSIDRATAGRLTAAGTISLITGPDGQSSSGHSFGSNTSTYTRTATNTYAGNFSASFWVSAPPYNLDVFRISGTNPLYARFTDATTISFSGLGTVTVASVASGWHHFVIVRSATTITVYQNNVVKGTITNNPATSYGGGNFSMGASSAVIGIADFRMYTKALTAAQISYYYLDVTANSGNIVMPMV